MNVKETVNSNRFFGEHPVVLAVGIAFNFSLLFLVLYILWVSDKPNGYFICPVLIFFIYRLFIRVILKVSFGEEQILVKRFFGIINKVNYSDIFEMYKNKEGIFPFHVYVIKYRNDKGSKKKITFYAREFDLKKIVNEKGLRGVKVSNY